MTSCRFAAFAAFVLLGCSSSKSGGGSGPGANFDAAGVDVNFNQDSGGGGNDAGHEPTDGGSDGSALGPGCSLLDAEAPDGACNTLVQLGKVITGTCPGGTQPTGKGGTIAAGTYVLTARAGYGSGCVAGNYQTTMLISDGCLQRVDGTDVRRNQDISTSGDQLMRTSSCGPGLPAATYTATDTQLVIFDQGGAVTTWTKQ